MNKNFTLIYRLIYTFSVKVNTANSVAKGSLVKSGEKLFQPILQIAMILRAKAKRHQPFGIITSINNLEICIVPIRKIAENEAFCIIHLAQIKSPYKYRIQK